ncbi:MAG: sigma-70 family RNA polymerase sigma factor [Ruminiclostridium sp.]|nr:sigma-70 family RNA polymerase sigma factor [Ruminiclostridium sp.]
MLEAAGTLNKKQYEVFVRFYLYGEPLTEISERMGIGSSDARTTLFRAREAIRKYLSERGYFDE